MSILKTIKKLRNENRSPDYILHVIEIKLMSEDIFMKELSELVENIDFDSINKQLSVFSENREMFLSELVKTSYQLLVGKGAKSMIAFMDSKYEISPKINV